MLLQHGWLASLSKPQKINEEEEGKKEDDMDSASSRMMDPEVAEWVKNALDRKKNGLIGDNQKPALQAAPFDTYIHVSSPG